MHFSLNQNWRDMAIVLLPWENKTKLRLFHSELLLIEMRFRWAEKYQTRCRKTRGGAKQTLTTANNVVRQISAVGTSASTEKIAQNTRDDQWAGWLRTLIDWPVWTGTAKLDPAHKKMVQEVRSKLSFDFVNCGPGLNWPTCRSHRPNPLKIWTNPWTILAQNRRPAAKIGKRKAFGNGFWPYASQTIGDQCSRSSDCLIFNW